MDGGEAGVTAVTFGGQCCFCGNVINAEGPDPLEVNVTTATGKWQVWWCHAACFKAQITDPPGAEGYFAPAHF
jgi:hypothetical protein